MITALQCKHCHAFGTIEEMHIYVWNSRKLDDEEKHFVDGSEKGILCEKCAKKLGAWQLQMGIGQWQKNT